MIRLYMGSTLLVAAALAGCTHVSGLSPPAEYLRDCTYDTSVPRTNGELLRQRNDRGDALDLCNADKAALREWAKNIK